MNCFNYEPIEKTKNSCKVHTDHKVDYIKLVQLQIKATGETHLGRGLLMIYLSFG